MFIDGPDFRPQIIEIPPACLLHIHTATEQIHTFSSSFSWEFSSSTLRAIVGGDEFLPFSMVRKKILMSCSSEFTKNIMTPGSPTQKLQPISNNFSKSEAKRVSQEFVFDVYDKIAPHFSHTRYFIEGFLNNVLTGTKCGLKWRSS